MPSSGLLLLTSAYFLQFILQASQRTAVEKSRPLGAFHHLCESFFRHDPQLTRDSDEEDNDEALMADSLSSASDESAGVSAEGLCATVGLTACRTAEASPIRCRLS